MLFAPNPGILAAGVGSDPYQLFLDHINTRSGGSFRAFDATSLGNATYTTLAFDPAGLTMAGSSWGPSAASGRFRRASTSVGRIVQHGLLNEATFNRQVAGGLALLLVSEDLGTFSPYSGVNRNGFNSSNSSSSGVAGRIIEITWWEPDLAEARTINPTATSPTVTTYTGHLT